MKLKFIFGISILLLLVGCAQQGPVNTNYQSGTEALKLEFLEGSPPVCIYFTDGYGQFPTEAPELEALWVISSGGLESRQVPFGEVVRMGV